MAVKLAAIRQLYEAAVWRGLRQDNPAAGLKAPKDKTERTERIKFLPPDGAHEVYDPRNYNDRLLLGLKGTLSEAQWYQMRTQLYAALSNKARHSELAIRLPVGYDRGEAEVVFQT